MSHTTASSSSSIASYGLDAGNTAGNSNSSIIATSNLQSSSSPNTYAKNNSNSSVNIHMNTNTNSNNNTTNNTNEDILMTGDSFRLRSVKFPEYELGITHVKIRDDYCYMGLRKVCLYMYTYSLKILYVSIF